MQVFFVLAIFVFACSFQSTQGDGEFDNYYARREGGRESRFRTCHQLIRASNHQVQDCARIGSTLYFIVKQNGNWRDACQTCQRYGGYLSPIRNFREYQLFVAFGNAGYVTDNLWIGGKRIDNNWVWIDDNEPMWYNQWLPGFPTNHPSCDCAAGSVGAQLSSANQPPPLNGWATTYFGFVDLDCNSNALAYCTISQRRRGSDIRCF